MTVRYFTGRLGRAGLRVVELIELIELGKAIRFDAAAVVGKLSQS
jgi:hypothetical protein